MIPDTQPYLILGLIAAFGLLGFQILSMVIRWRNLQKDAQLLDQLEQDERA